MSCISFSQALNDKVGIRNGDDLMCYLMATTGLDALSMRMEGVEKPMARFNIIQAGPNAALIQSRLEKLITKIEKGTAPSMSEVNKGLDQLVAQSEGMQRTNVK